MLVKGVIFDLGSTLMYLDGEWEDVRAQNVTNVVAFLRAQGLCLEEQNFGAEYHRQRARGYADARATHREYLARRSLQDTLIELGHPPLSEPVLMEATKALFFYEEARWLAYPDAVPTLRVLQSGGFPLALASNASDDEFIQRLLVKLRLERYLRPALNSAGVGVRKPDSRMFQLILDEWGLEPAEVVMVGDTLRADILGAHLLGMRSVLALMDENPENEAWRDSVIPDETIETLAELPSLLAAM
jgi:HAD superfamily hydrolase (TIGR01549 family)